MATLFLALQCVQCSTMQVRASTKPTPVDPAPVCLTIDLTFVLCFPSTAR